MVDEISVSASMSIQQIVASDTQDNVFTFAAAKVGSKSFGSDGTKFIFTRESLKAYAASWTDGIITLNHTVTDGGKITAAWFDETTEMAMMTVEATNDDTAQRIRDGEPTGVSIEATVTDVDEDNNVLAFDGTGVGIIFYPEQPACPATDGCGVLAKDQFEQKVTKVSAKRMTQIKSTEYDLARVNDTGDLVKIGDLYVWDEYDETDSDIEGQIASYTSYYGTGEYSLLESSDTKLGDTVSGDAFFTSTVNVSKTVMGSAKMGDEPKIETVSKSDYDEVVAKTVEMQSEIDAFKTDEAIKARDADITAKDAEIVELKTEIDRRDSEISASLLEDIKAWDAEFVPEEGLELSTIQTIHASLKRVADKDAEVKASEQEPVEEVVEAKDFVAPKTPAKSGGLTIGGIQNGKWIGGKKE